MSAPAPPAAPAAAAAPQKPWQAKLVLLGEAAVGKSSVVLRFVSDEYVENKEPTIGAAFLTQKCRLDSAIIKFEIWDTAGQERFHSLAPMYYRNAQAAAVVYDVTKASSFEKAKSWIKELQRQANPNIVIALVGNKLDLLGSAPATASGSGEAAAEETEAEAAEEDDAATTTGADAAPGVARAVPKEEAEAYAQETSLLFFETSAKTGEGVVELFTEIAKKIPIDAIAAQQAQARAAAPAGGASTPGRTAGGGGLRVGNNEGAGRGDACNC